jgi:hypothetical protein
MNCLDVASNLQLFIDEELPSPEMEDVQSHLGLCDECNHRFESERLFKQTLKDKLPKRAVSTAMRDDVRHLVLQLD